MCKWFASGSDNVAGRGRCGLKGWWCVKENRVFLSRVESMPFFGHDMKLDRTLQILYHSQILAQKSDVMPVDGTDITEA